MDKNDINTSTSEELSIREYKRLEPNVHIDLVNAITAIDNVNTSDDGIKIYRTDPENPRELFIHNSFDIIYVENSDSEIIVCGECMPLKKGSLLFLSPGTPYRISATDHTVVPVITIKKNMIITHFHSVSKLDGTLSGFFANGLWGESVPGYLLYTKLLNPSVHTALGLMLSEETHRNKHSIFVMTHLLLTIFGCLSDQNHSTHILSSGKIARSDQISKLMTFIQDNYRTITLEKLADHFHYTVPYVSKLIRNATGLTFTEILREIKFDVCRSLLVNSDLKINKIAEVAGFQNTDHFNRIFKKRMGKTPTEYKKNTGAGIDK